jgi:Peptidase family S58
MCRFFRSAKRRVSVSREVPIIWAISSCVSGSLTPGLTLLDSRYRALHSNNSLASFWPAGCESPKERTSWHALLYLTLSCSAALKQASEFSFMKRRRSSRFTKLAWQGQLSARFQMHSSLMVSIPLPSSLWSCQRGRSRTNRRGMYCHRRRNYNVFKFIFTNSVNGMTLPSRAPATSHQDVAPASHAAMENSKPEAYGSEGNAGAGAHGAGGSNGSGDYVIAFSTAPQVRIHMADKASTRHVEVLTNDVMSPLFLAVIEATEEAVYNSLFRARTITGRGHTVDALPIEKTTEILKKYGVMK